MPVVVAGDLEATRRFYVDFLGFEIAMDNPGFLMLRSASVPTTQLIVCAADGDTADPHVRMVDMSVEVDDVEAAHADAIARGLEIVYPITDEPWGVRRFFCRDPAGTVVNVAMHIAS